MQGSALRRNSRSEKPVSVLHGQLDLLDSLIFLPIEPFDFLSIGFPRFSGRHSRGDFLPGRHEKRIHWSMRKKEANSIM
jgi:hypothetical protein